LNCLVVVAHPDDETIWMGGLILRHPSWSWRVLALSRVDDLDRVARFRGAGRELHAKVSVSDLDDSVVLKALSPDLREIKDRIRVALEGASDARPDVCDVRSAACGRYDLVFTHGARGEYTWHERHEQVHRAVREMRDSGRVAGDLVFFAYEDGGGAYPPRAATDARIILPLTTEEYVRKMHIVWNVYGYGKDSFEARAAGPVEAFTTSASEQIVAQLRSGFETPDH